MDGENQAVKEDPCFVSGQRTAHERADAVRELTRKAACAVVTALSDARVIGIEAVDSQRQFDDLIWQSMRDIADSHARSAYTWKELAEVNEQEVY
jgi:hypothetical protein